MNGVEIKDTPESALFFDTLSERLEIECMMKTPRALRRKNVKVDKLQDAILAGGKHSSDCTLILTEGDSAKTFAMSGLGIIGHDRYGVFPLRGKALNARDESAVRIMANIEWNGVLSALGLQLGSPATSSMRYGHVMILADADLDGVHIAGLIINFFASQFPHLLLEKHDIVDMMKVTDPNMITYEEKDNMLGIQVVLLDNCTWKLTVVKENKEVHVVEAARTTRKRRSSDAFDSTTFSTNSLYEIFVDVPDVGLRYTTVVSKLVTINVAFKRKDMTSFAQPESVWASDGSPRIAQRRIEVCFMNRNVFACQVSAPVF